MLLVAAAGTLVYGLSDTLAGLMVGRLLIGAGVCVCLGAAFQALAQNFPLARLPMVNGLVMAVGGVGGVLRSEEHTSELQSLMRISYAVFCLKKKTEIQ